MYSKSFLGIAQWFHTATTAPHPNNEEDYILILDIIDTFRSLPTTLPFFLDDPKRKKVARMLRVASENITDGIVLFLYFVWP